MQKIASLFVSLCLLALLGQVNMANGETVGERFDKALKEIAKQCASRQGSRGGADLSGREFRQQKQR